MAARKQTYVALLRGINLGSRNRIAMVDPSLGDRIGMAVMEPGSLVMERKMLHGIKERAERLAAAGPIEHADVSV